ncbi:MAG: Rrf2 family transcriptional regulator [Gammaproteobacteria bacterium]|jgi:Rrf2 family nitric oxide-sensitive transcriptional repressor|nr:Rrf2 family transcriptional regulator [Gammaproteobacteria bacterium]
MQLTQYTDYSLRTLIYLGLRREGLSTITEISDSYGISRNHLVKVVHQLGAQGLIVTVRGKGGGIRLASSPDEINVGDVVRRFENLALVECFSDSNTCAISPSCRLRGVLQEAMRGFMEVLDRYTLQDLLVGKKKMKGLLSLAD